MSSAGGKNMASAMTHIRENVVSKAFSRDISLALIEECVTTPYSAFYEFKTIKSHLFDI